MNRYENLANVLSDRIEQGLYPAGIRLPSVRVLSSEHGVSVSTVQQAYRELERSGLVYVRRGQGTFVAALNGDAAAERNRLGDGLAQRALQDAYRHGLGAEELVAAIRRVADRSLTAIKKDGGEE